PRVDVQSRLTAEQLLILNLRDDSHVRTELLPDGEHTFRPDKSATGLLWRLADRPVSYVEVIEESDFRELHICRRANGECESRWQLFAEFLEKGVIRRARVHAAFLPREGDVESAAAFCRAVGKSALPLTT